MVHFGDVAEYRLDNFIGMALVIGFADYDDRVVVLASDAVMGMPIHEKYCTTHSKGAFSDATRLRHRYLTHFPGKLQEEHRYAAPKDGTGNQIAIPFQTPEALDDDTISLIQDMASAVATKLYVAQKKYGYTNNWSIDDWEVDARKMFHEHVAKGDPLDIIAIASFIWKRGYKVNRPGG